MENRPTIRPVLTITLFDCVDLLELSWVLAIPPENGPSLEQSKVQYAGGSPTTGIPNDNKDVVRGASRSDVGPKDNIALPLFPIAFEVVLIVVTARTYSDNLGRVLIRQGCF